MKYLSFKKVSDGQSVIYITINYVFLFPQIIRSQKNWCETLKLKFMLLFFIVSIRYVLPTLWLSIQFAPILLVERLFKWSWVLFYNFILWLANPGSKMPCILLFEIEYSLQFVSTNLFYPVLPIPRFKQLLFGVSYSKNPKNLKTYVFGLLFFDMQI